MKVKLKKNIQTIQNNIDLFIIGSGQLGKLICKELKKIPIYNIKGFIDNNSNQKNYEGFKIYKDESFFLNKKKLNLVLAIGDIKKRLEIIKKFSKFTFLTIILNNTFIENLKNIGSGSIIMPHAKILDNTKIGKFCLIGTNVNILHDVVVGNNCILGGGTIVGANTYIEKNVLIGVGSIISSNKKKIGENSIICSGTVVHKNIKKNSKVIGNPYKYII